jgi:HlyD family secretion protein
MVEKQKDPFGEPFERQNSGWRGLLTLSLMAGIGAIAATGYWYFQPRSVSSQTSSPAPALLKSPLPSTPTAVSALGQLEPKGKITRLSAPATLEGSRLDQVLIQEGQTVQAGQVVAVLDSQTRRLAAVRKAESDVAIAQAKLEQVKSGQGAEEAAQAAIVSRASAEEGAVTAQLGTIQRLNAQLADAQTQFGRFEQLHKEGGISAADLDARRLSVTTIMAQLREAEANLARLQAAAVAQVKEAEANLTRSQQTNPTDVRVAEAELVGAQAALAQAKTDLELSFIRSPIAGTVLRVNARSGEAISQQGIAEIGRTGQMEVVAQVHKTDIQRVKVGQTAKVTSEVFQGELKGTVSEIGLQVKKQEVFDSNPLAVTSNDVVDVRIRLDLDASNQVASLSNLQVQVAIAI